MAQRKTVSGMNSKYSLEQLSAIALTRDEASDAIQFEGFWLSWGDINRTAHAVVLELEKSGVKPGSPVIFVSRNRPSAYATLLALLSQGYAIRLMYPFQSAASLARQIEHQPAAALLAAESEFSPEICEVLLRLGMAGIAVDDQAVLGGKGCEPSTIIFDTTPNTRQIGILTSGTTGPPKQFAVSYQLIENYVANSGKDVVSEPPALLYFPLANITGIYTSLPPLISGQRMVLLDRFSLAGWHQFVRHFKPTSSGIPPAAMSELLAADIPASDLASLQYMGSGAAPLDPALHREFESRYDIPILLSYGATEFGGPVSAMTLDQHRKWGEQKFGSVGIPFPGFSIRVVDSQSGRTLRANEEGVLEVISPRVSQQWIRTSDLGVIDGDGFVFLRGRDDGAIMRGGFKVLPESIEAVLLIHPMIVAASVVSAPDARLGEVPGAAIKIEDIGVAPRIEDIEAHLREHLLATHIPVHWRIVNDLPTTPSFKIDRPAVKRLFGK